MSDDGMIGSEDLMLRLREGYLFALADADRLEQLFFKIAVQQDLSHVMEHAGDERFFRHRMPRAYGDFARPNGGAERMLPQMPDRKRVVFVFGNRSECKKGQ